MKPLETEAAVQLFCDIAPEHRGHGMLDALLRPLDGVPLAIELLAHAADGSNLALLAEEWQARRTEMLEREGGKPDRLSSWAVSLELSVGSRRMTEEAKRLGALLARLPDGIATEDLPALLPGPWAHAARKLTEVGLAYDEGERLKMLAPVREYLARRHPPTAENLDRAMRWYAELALSLGPKVGAKGGAEAAARLEPETANLDAMIRQGLQGHEPNHWIDAAIALTNFARTSGHSIPSPLGAALEAARRAGSTQQEAGCITSLGDMAYGRSNHDTATEQYQTALPLYRQAGDVLGEANCIQRLGHIALERSDHDTATKQYETALRLYKQVGDVLNEANCISSLGYTTLRRLDHNTATMQYQAALRLYKQAGDVLGEANCIAGLGEIAQERSDHVTTTTHYQAALQLYRQVGHLLGEANCIAGLGHIARRRSDHDAATTQYQAALRLYKQVGSMQGEANCILGLGEIALAQSRAEQARSCFEQALALYARIPEPYSIGWARLRLARLATGPERRQHIETARVAWTGIDRPDLVALLDSEFRSD